MEDLIEIESESINGIRLRDNINSLIDKTREYPYYDQSSSVKKYRYSANNTQVTLEDIDESTQIVVIVDTNIPTNKISKKRNKNTDIGTQIVIIVEGSSMQISISDIYEKKYQNSNIKRQYTQTNRSHYEDVRDSNGEYTHSEFVPIESLKNTGTSLILGIIRNLIIYP